METASTHYTPGDGLEARARFRRNAALHGSTHRPGHPALLTYSSMAATGIFQISINELFRDRREASIHLDGASHYATQFNQIQTNRSAGLFDGRALRLGELDLPPTTLRCHDTFPAATPHATRRSCIRRAGVWDQHAEPGAHGRMRCGLGLRRQPRPVRLRRRHRPVRWHHLERPARLDERVLRNLWLELAVPDAFAVGVASDGTTGVIYHYY